MNVRLAVSLCCLMMVEDLGECRLMRRRREDCEYGTYPLKGKTCCLCPSGFSAKDFNNCTDKVVTNCEPCGPNSFTTQPNSESSCHGCKICDPNAGMETKEKCSPSYNTVCGCMEGHYCDKGDLCRVCQPCDTCEERGVKIHCTSTNNTVCNDAVDSNGKIIGAVIGVLVALLVVALIVFVIWRKKICFKDKTEEKTVPPEELIDVDLNPYIEDIASIMKPAMMRRVARRTGMPPVDIEQHQENHPKDVKEQTYRLLQDWYEFQGLSKAYPTLLKTLQEQGHKTTADQIRKIVKRDEATAKLKTVNENSIL